MNYRILEKENSWFVPQYRWVGIWRCWVTSHEYGEPLYFKKYIDAYDFIQSEIKGSKWKDRVVYEVKV